MRKIHYCPLLEQKGYNNLASNVSQKQNCQTEFHSSWPLKPMCWVKPNICHKEITTFIVLISPLSCKHKCCWTAWYKIVLHQCYHWTAVVIPGGSKNESKAFSITKCTCVRACLRVWLPWLLSSLFYWVPFLVLGCYCSFWLGISGFIWSWNDDEGCWVWPRVLSHHFAVSSKITPPHHQWSTLVRNLIHYKDKIKVDQSKLCKTLNLNFS